MFVGDQHASLFCHTIGDEEKKSFITLAIASSKVRTLVIRLCVLANYSDIIIILNIILFFQNELGYRIFVL
jgi:hypothetical protein